MGLDITFLNILVPTLTALLAVFWVYFKILRIAKTKKLVDNPDDRKLQKEPVPLLGGLAVFIGVLAGFSIASCLFEINMLQPVILMMGIMLFVGMIDDLHGIKPSVRLVLEAFCILVLCLSSNSCIDNFHGLWEIRHISHAIALPVTVFAGVGIINAINMIDGVNGLSSGICILCCFFFGGVFYKNGDIPNATMACIMAAALVPFLLHNVFGKTSRMFIGDAGTMMMGVLITWFVIHTLGEGPTLIIPGLGSVSGNFGEGTFMEAEERGIGMVAITLSILIVPIFDTIRVMMMRIFRGQSPFHADKTHLHHAFIACGFSHCFISLCEIFIGVLVYYICYTTRHFLFLSATNQFYVVVVSGIIFVWGTYFYLSHLSRRPGISSTRLVMFSHFGHCHWWTCVQKWLDAPEHHVTVDEEQVQKKIDRKFRN